MTIRSYLIVLTISLFVISIWPIHQGFQNYPQFFPQTENAPGDALKLQCYCSYCVLTRTFKNTVS